MNKKLYKKSYCEACEKKVSVYSKYSHIKSTAHMKKHKNFRLIADLTDRKYIFDDPDVFLSYPSDEYSHVKSTAHIKRHKKFRFIADLKHRIFF